MRLPTKPSHTPTSTGSLPICRASRNTAAMTLPSVSRPCTTSSKRMTFAGLKKCMPSTCVGRRVKPAISSMSRRDVFDARMAWGLQRATMRAVACS
ncbi:hypothetical protein D3C73_1508270 [compost metagenome]